MDAEVVRIWATPSTLHLRLVVHGARGKWMRSCEIHMPWETLSPGERQRLREALEEDQGSDEAAAEQPGLF